jgi:hypothetical protein
MAGDWLKLHRRAIDSQVFSDPHLWHLFCWCLLRANWKPGYFKGIEIPPGSFACGRNAAADEIGVNPSTLYKRLKKLESVGVISLSGNNRFTTITVQKWAYYQDGSGDGNNQVTTKEQPSNSQVTTREQPGNTIEEGKKVRREEGKTQRSDCADFQEWYSAYPKKVAKEAAAKAYAKAIKSIDPDELLAASLPRLAELSKREPRYIPHPATWLNSGGWQDDLAAIAPAAKSAFGPGQDYDPNHDYESEIF